MYLIPIFYAKMNTMRDKNCHPWRIPERDLQSPPVVVLKLWRLMRSSIYTMSNTDGFVKSPTSELRCILRLACSMHADRSLQRTVSTPHS